MGSRHAPHQDHRGRTCPLRRDDARRAEERRAGGLALRHRRDARGRDRRGTVHEREHRPAQGRVYTHGNFAAQIEALRAISPTTGPEKDLATFPLFALFDPALGMTTVVPDMDPSRPAKVDPAKMIAPILEHGVTTMFASPAVLKRVARYGTAHGVKLPTLRRVISQARRWTRRSSSSS